MQNAQSLSELLQIRDENRACIDQNDSIEATALGRKNGEGDPCVLVFVDRKISSHWLKPDVVVPTTLTAKGGLSCPTDVIETRPLGFYPDMEARLLHVSTDGKPRLIETEELLGYGPLKNEAKLDLLKRLRGQWQNITPGARIASFKNSGTLSCFAQDDKGLGILTNEHVSGREGNELYSFTYDYGTRFATTSNTVYEIPADQRFPNLFKNFSGTYRVDAAFARLDPAIDESQIDPRLPVINSNNKIEMKTLGPPFPLDLDTMGPVGERVVGVGQMRSHQIGKIFAFGFEYRNDPFGSIDYLIIGDEKDDQFSHPGDSGKLIVSADDSCRPIALMWGGWYHRFRPDQGIENLSYATDIGVVLDRLKIKLFNATPHV